MTSFRFLIPVLVSLLLLGVGGCRGKSDASKNGGRGKSSPLDATQSHSALIPDRSPVASVTPRVIVRRRALPQTTAPFAIRHDGIFLPGYDDRGSTAPPEILRLPANVFARTTHIYDERAVCTRPNNETTTFTIPTNANEIGLLLRGRAVEDEWPRIRVSLVDAREPLRRHVLFEGNIVWRELRYLWWPVPTSWRKHLVFVRVEVLNPEYHFAQRAAYIAAVIL
ncbi:MAG: hypothetical protein ACP5QZ_02045, partial [Candidatus Sumerlaeaceae bacterium]